MVNEFGKLQQRWQRKTGEPMPISIASLPIDRIRFAVKQVELGNHVVVPSVPVTAEVVNEDSLMDWDKHGEFG